MSDSIKRNVFPMLIIGALFFIFGFVTWVNSTLIPYLKIACELTYSQALLVTFAFYISYFVMAFPSSWVLKITGFKKGMSLGLFVMALGAFIFVPAANSRTFNLFLLGLFIIGTGLSILQTASNPYITILGPLESAAKRISIMGICNKVAGMLAPLILGAIVLANSDELESKLAIISSNEKILLLDELASRVITPYIIIGVILIILAGLIHLSPLPEIEPEEQLNDTTSKKKNIFAYPNLILGVIALFFYVGVEVIAVDTINNYGISQGISLSTSKYFSMIPLFAMLLGYIVGIFTIPKIISQSKALSISAILGVILTIGTINTDGYNSILLISLLGLANALMWPAIWPLAIDGLGRFTKTGSAMLIMAIAGGAILPVVYGYLADAEKGIGLGNQQAYWIMVPCYLFILYYSLKGSKIVSWK